MASPRVKLAGTIQPASVAFAPQPDIFKAKIAFEILVARPYAEVTDVMSYVTKFFPFISGAKVTYPDNFPHEKLKINEANNLLNKTFQAQKLGMEDAPSDYQYVNVEYNNERFTLVTLLRSDNSSSFRNFYNVTSCTAGVDGTTRVHAETGFTLAMNIGDTVALKIVSTTLKFTLERIHLWMTHPAAALQQTILRWSLIRINPPASEERIGYTSKTKFNCTTQQLIDFMKKENKNTVAHTVLGCEQQLDGIKFSKKVPTAGEANIEIQKSRANIISFAPSSVFNVSKLYVELEAQDGVTYGLDAASSMLSVKTSGSFLLDKSSKMRTFFKEWMSDYNAKIIQRVATALQQQHNINDITPGLSQPDVIPEELRPGLKMRK